MSNSLSQQSGWRGLKARILTILWPRLAFLSARSRQSGSALLIILGCVALLTVLVLSFFVTARSESSASNFYARGVNTKLLSENVINLVMAQLREGARSTDVNSPTTPIAWVSQPGLIRTYGNTGSPYKYFKLFSSDTMIGAGQYPNTDTPPTGWSTQPNIYTDLNAPVNSDYPIVDPTATTSVEGFSYTTAPDTTVAQPLPMPVKWLYVLKSGATAVALASTPGTAVTVPGASATNPIIGRVAFWTDDETSKVNINTASEGIFWDTPVGETVDEIGSLSGVSSYGATINFPYGFSSSIPAAEEFQRTPGHPATTSLSAVLGYGTNPPLPDTRSVSLTWPLTAGSTGTYSSFFAPYYTITPRYQPGGSMGGAQVPGTGFGVSGYRLYDSVDELNYDPARLPDTYGDANLYTATTGASPTGRTSFPRLTPAVIEKSRFFLTAHSRGPEETLFGTPRISLWPLQAPYADPVQGTILARTAKDNLLAFCSTITANNNGTATPEPYYFQRATYYQYKQNGGNVSTVPISSCSAQSATLDFPGAPNSALAAGTATVGRNQNLYAYLQAMTSANNPIPGFGGSFASKYPGTGGVSDRDQILTEMFDLLRSGVNTFNVGTTIFPNYTYTPYYWNGGSQPGCGMTVPIHIPSNGTYGLGRTYGIAEVSLVFMASSIDLSGSSAGTLDTNAPNVFVPLTPRRISIGSGLPWACEEDYNSNIYLYYDSNTQAYGNYYIALSTPPTGVLTPYIYPPTQPPTPVPLATSTPVPIFCYWDSDPHVLKYGSYFRAPVGAPGAGSLLTCASPPNPPAPPPAMALPSTAVTIGDPQTTQVQAFLVVRPYLPVVGIPPAAPNVRVEVSNLDALHLTTSLGTSSMGFPVGANAVSTFNSYNFAGGFPLSGLPDSTMGRSPGINDGTGSAFPLYSSTISVPTSWPTPFGGEDPFASPGPSPATVQIHKLVDGNGAYLGTTMSIDGTTLKIEVRDGVSPTMGTAQPIQTVWVKIPPMTLPVPTIEMANGLPYHQQEDEAFGPALNNAGIRVPGNGGSPPGTPQPLSPTYQVASGQVPNPNPVYNLTPLTYYWQTPYDPRTLATRIGNTDTTRLILRGDVVRSFVLNPNGPYAGDMRLMAVNPIRLQPPSNLLAPATDDFVPLGSSKSVYTDATQGPYTSLFIKQLHSLMMEGGNYRTMMNLVATSQAILTATPIAQLTMDNTHGGQFGGGMGETNGALFQNETYAAASAPDVTPELNGAFMSPGVPGDWSTGMGPSGDGPFVIKPDEGYPVTTNSQIAGSIYFDPYYTMSFGNLDLASSLGTYSPNRQVPSPLIFGTLPSRAIQGVPWCTLLFNPNPAANDAGAVHPGFGSGSGVHGPSDYAPYTVPPDHLFLDLFWMPVVEPYAISEPFSTAGKVNMNYQIVPFGYIHRSTALHAVLKSTQILAIPADGVLNGVNANSGTPLPTAAVPQPTSNWPNIKPLDFYMENAGGNYSYRYQINLKATIDDANSAFQVRFGQNDLFRSASEICNVFLVPQAISGKTYYSSGSQTLPALPTDASYASMSAWWSKFKLTGDNSRKSPYSQIYPRLTTKSNSFEVHMQVQVLTQTPADRATGTFNSANGDSVTGEYRGSAIIERYLDPNQTNPPLPDFATTFPNDPTSTLDNYVRYRVVSVREFSQ